jgi:hypothetical protein
MCSDEAPLVLPSLMLMAANVVVLEMGRRGLWPSQGVGFSPWYPVMFAAVHLVFWPVKMFIDRSCRWWWLVAEIVLMLSFLSYNYTSLKMIMYVS